MPGRPGQYSSAIVVNGSTLSLMIRACNVYLVAYERSIDINSNNPFVTELQLKMSRLTLLYGSK